MKFMTNDYVTRASRVPRWSRRCSGTATEGSATSPGSPRSETRVFILSYVTLKGAVKPNPSAHKCFVSLTEASDRIEKMIVSNDDCIYPVSVPVPHRNDTSDDNNNSMEDIGVVSDLSCYACGYLAEHWRELNKHTETHIEKRCQECERFIGTNSLFKIGGNRFWTPVCTSVLYCIDNFLEVLWI